MEDPACIAVQHRILWKCRNDNLTTTKYVNIESQEEISQRFKIRPPRRTLFHLCSNAVVVVQEFALTCFLLARHHIALFYNQDAASPQQHVYLELSTAAIVLALLTAVVFSARADQSQQQDRKTKIIQRSSDAILLGLLLRWMAGILQSLTASYSSDTVRTRDFPYRSWFATDGRTSISCRPAPSLCLKTAVRRLHA